MKAPGNDAKLRALPSGPHVTFLNKGPQLKGPTLRAPGNVAKLRTPKLRGPRLRAPGNGVRLRAPKLRAPD